MSSFNPAQFQTDQMAAGLAVEGNRQRNAGIQYIGSAAAGAAEQFNQAQMQMAQLQIADAEATAKIGAWQQEQALNELKMQQAIALDQAMISRHQVTLAEVQANSAMMEFKQREAAYKGEEQNYRKMGVQAALSAGMHFNEQTGEWEAFKDDAAREAATKQFQETEYRSQGNYSPGLDRRRLMQDIEAAEALGDDKLLESLRREMAQQRGIPYEPLEDDKGNLNAQPIVVRSPEARAADDAADREANRHLALLNAVRGDQQLAPIASAALQAPEWQSSPFWNRLGGDEKDRTILSAGIARLAGSLLRGESGSRIDPKMAHAVIMQSVEQSPVSMAFLLAQTNDTDKEIRLKLKALYGMGDGDVSNVMKALDRNLQHYGQ